MQLAVNLRRLAGTVAVTATGVGGALAMAACTQTTPTATVTDETVVITGTVGVDKIRIASDASQLTVDFGFDDVIDAQFERSLYEDVQLQAGDGDDVVSLSGTGDVPITASAGAGNDVMTALDNFGEIDPGGAPTTLSSDDGNDSLFASTPTPLTLQTGAGDDRVEVGGGGLQHDSQTAVSLGAGNDLLRTEFHPFGGIASGIFDGGAGQDALEVQGTLDSESVGLSANAGHLIVEHSVREHIDADNVEDVSYFGFGGLSPEGSGDAIAVNDLSGTDVVRFTPNFNAGPGSTEPNNSADTLTVRGTAGVDHITVSGSGSSITVAGLAPTVAPILLQPEDFLNIVTLGGDDIVDSSGLQPGLVQLLVS